MFNGNYVFKLAPQRSNGIQTLKNRVTTAVKIVLLWRTARSYSGRKECLKLSTPFKK